MTYDHWKATNPADECLGLTPEVYVECEHCGGEGGVEKWEGASRWSTDPPSAIIVPCEACNGTGGYICEAEGDL